MKKWLIAILLVLMTAFSIQFYGTDIEQSSDTKEQHLDKAIPANGHAFKQQDIIDNVLHMELQETVPENLPRKHHAFVVLGSALSENGMIKEKLLERLKVSLAAANKYRDSKIILSGGKEKNGVSEADAMYRWLQEHGINRNRMIKEGKSEDTVENAKYTFEIIERYNIRRITLVTSASHIRRAQAVFSQVNQTYDGYLDQPITHVVHMDYSDPDEANHVTAIQKAKIYLDVMRARE